VGLLLTACEVKPTREAFTAYVVNEGPGTVTPFSTLTGRVFKAIKVDSFPQAIAITPDGKTAYVANADSDTVTPDQHRHQPGGAADQGWSPARCDRDHPRQPDMGLVGRQGLEP
jgi:sugar lactone lactonase YvrE